MHQLRVVLDAALSAQNALFEIGAQRVELGVGFRQRRAVRRVQGSRHTLQEQMVGAGQGKDTAEGGGVNTLA